MAEISNETQIKYHSLFSMNSKGLIIFPESTIKNKNSFIFYGSNNLNWYGYSKFESYYSMTSKKNKLYKLTIEE